LKPGEDWEAGIKRAIDDSKMCVLVVSKDFETKPWVTHEWAMVQEKAWDRADLLVIPLLLDGVDPPTFVRPWSSVRCQRRTADVERVCSQLVERLAEPPGPSEKSPGETHKDTVERFKKISQALEALAEGRSAEEDPDE